MSGPDCERKLPLNHLGTVYYLPIAFLAKSTHKVLFAKSTALFRNRTFIVGHEEKLFIKNKDALLQ